MRIPLSFKGNYQELSGDKILELYENGKIDIQNTGTLFSVLDDDKSKFYEYQIWSADARVETQKGVPEFVATKKIDNALIELRNFDLNRISDSEVMHKLNSSLDDIKILSIKDSQTQRYVYCLSKNAICMLTVKEDNKKPEKDLLSSQPSC